MTKQDKLPPYFQKYLDQRFTTIELQLDEIKGMFAGVDKRIDQNNKLIAQNSKLIARNTSWRKDIMAKLTLVATVGSFFLTLLVEWVKSFFQRTRL